MTGGVLMEVMALRSGRADPGFYIALALNVILLQTLVWSLARHSADIEVWRTFAVVLMVGTIMLFGTGPGTLEGIVTAAMVAMVVGWILLGYVFDLEAWQRAVVAVAAPIVAIISLLVGQWLDDLIFGSGLLLA